jgi:hypothetical protein
MTTRLLNRIVMSEEEKPLSPTTTAQQDITTAGQRKINLIWEYTQAGIAIMVTLALIYTAISKIESAEIRDAFFLIIGFYFSRTNHQAIGGIGSKPTQKYEGR